VVQVNGETRPVPHGCSLEQLLTLLEVGNRRVAVAVNRNVVARSHYATTKLSDGDRVEILEAVGGG
jgi:sulfur carrier protein